MATFSGMVIKPDITYYNSPRSNAERADVESAELMVEAKSNEQDDPFKVKPTVEGFLCDDERARQTLGQLTSYATAHLAAQFRTHVFSVLRFPKSARLMRWDRAGIIVYHWIIQCSPSFLEIQQCRCYEARSRPLCHSFYIHEGFDKGVFFWLASVWRWP